LFVVRAVRDLTLIVLESVAGSISDEQKQDFGIESIVEATVEATVDREGWRIDAIGIGIGIDIDITPSTSQANANANANSLPFPKRRYHYENPIRSRNDSVCAVTFILLLNR